MKNIRIASSQFDTELAEDEVSIVIDRTSKLKNPFYLHEESERSKNIESYRKYFYDKVASDLQFKSELDRLLDLSEENSIVLRCWCYPKNNFVEIIVEWLKNQGKRTAKKDTNN